MDRALSHRPVGNCRAGEETCSGDHGGKSRTPSALQTQVPTHCLCVTLGRFWQLDWASQFLTSSGA